MPNNRRRHAQQLANEMTDRSPKKLWTEEKIALAPTIGRQPNKKIRMYVHPKSGCEIPWMGFVTLPEGLERGLQHGTAKLTRQYSPIASIAHKATGASPRLCLSTLNVLRSKARPLPQNPVNPHRQEQSASPDERPLACVRLRNTDLDVY
jgi:hypothetical protein